MTFVDDLVFEHVPEELVTPEPFTLDEYWEAWFGPYSALCGGAVRRYKVRIHKLGAGYQVHLIQTPGMPCGPSEDVDTLDEAKEKGRQMIGERLPWLLEEDRDRNRERCSQAKD